MCISLGYIIVILWVLYINVVRVILLIKPLGNSKRFVQIFNIETRVRFDVYKVLTDTCNKQDTEYKL